jgi:hypothetical protein
MPVTQIVTRLIANAAVTTAKIANNAITLALMGWGTTAGDLMYYAGSNTYTTVGIGSSSQVLTVVGGVPAWAAASTAAHNFSIGETPSGTVNGTNTTFVLSHSPVVGTVAAYVDGVRMNAGTGNDYTISGTTLTFLTGAIPQTGDTILADYQY